MNQRKSAVRFTGFSSADAAASIPLATSYLLFDLFAPLLRVPENVVGVALFLVGLGERVLQGNFIGVQILLAKQPKLVQPLRLRL